MEICEHLSCTACGVCVNLCNRNAVTLKENAEGFLYPFIDEDSCVKCGICKMVCPENKNINKAPAAFYMAWNKDEEIIKKSSSGGVFTALAYYVLQRGGVVFGAAKNPDTREVCHIMIDDAQGLDKLRLSKYYQSNTRKVYQQVKEVLLQNRYVLFSGTACQIAGVYSALEQWKVNPEIIRGERKIRRLITVDVLCHGCTSRKVVEYYIKAKEKEYKKQISDYHFRVKTKDSGWQSIGTKIEFADATYSIGGGVGQTLFLQDLILIFFCVNRVIDADIAVRIEFLILLSLIFGGLILKK